VSQPQQLTIEQAISRAKKAAKQGNDTKALQLYSAVLQRQPNHPVAKKGQRKLRKKLRHSQSIRAQTTEPSQDQIDAVINIYHSGQMERLELSCRELLQTHPQSLTVINLLGTALQVQGKLKEAVQAFDKAIQLKPDSAEAYSNRGNALKELGQVEHAVASYDDAVASYDQAIQLKPDFAEAYYNRGNGLRDLGRLDEAVASYDMAIRIKPDLAGAYLQLSALKKYQAGDTQIGIMESLLTDSQPNESSRIELCFALAKANEDLGKYDKSFGYLKEGNRLRKKELHYDIEVERGLFTKIKGIFASERSIPGVPPDEHASIRPLFIVGMMRSGTSLVEQILASHSKVHGAGELETMNQLVDPILSDFPDENVSQDKRKLSTVEIDTVRNAYLEALTALKVPEKIVTDKMPLNFRWIGFVLSAFPEAKIIHLNRDPKATCWSIYKHYFSTIGNGYAYDMGDLAEFYRLYVDLMSFWRERYPDRIYDLCYEDLTENQEVETRKLLVFCDLEWEEQCLDFHKTNRVVKTTSASQVRSKIYRGSSEAWRNYEDHLQPLIYDLAPLPPGR
jgi:tetratricopeptide (TPR) repeat protein